jgi:hypothetical protein
MSATSVAIRQFEENVRLFAPSTSQPEKFNLYGGLANIARAIESLQAEVTALKQTVAQLERRSK